MKRATLLATLMICSFASTSVAAVELRSDKEYLISDAPAKVSGENYKLLNLETKSCESSILIDKLQAADADIICVRGLLEDDMASAIYQALSSTYKYFARIGFECDEALPNGIYIISKYALNNFHFEAFEILPGQQIKGVYDFSIKHDSTPLARFYVVDPEAMPYIDYIYEQMERDHEEQNIPCFFEDKALAIHYTVETRAIPVDYPEQNTPPAWLTTIFNLISQSDNFSAYHAEPEQNGDDHKDHPRDRDREDSTTISGGASIDRRGNQSANLKVTREGHTKDGNKYDASLSGDIKKGPDGKTDAKITGSFSLRI